MAFVVSISAVVLSYPLSYFLAFHAGRRAGIYLVLLLVPFWTSYLLRVMAWKIMLGTDGVINSLLLYVGVIKEPLEALLYNRSAVILTLIYVWIPFAALPILAALQRIEWTLFEAAADLGTRPYHQFMRITLPLSLPGVIAAFFMVFIPTIGEYVTPLLVGGQSRVHVWQYHSGFFHKSRELAPRFCPFNDHARRNINPRLHRHAPHQAGGFAAMSNRPRAIPSFALLLQPHCISLSSHCSLIPVLDKHQYNLLLSPKRINARLVSKTLSSRRSSALGAQQPDRREREQFCSYAFRNHGFDPDDALSIQKQKSASGAGSAPADRPLCCVGRGLIAIVFRNSRGSLPADCRRCSYCCSIALHFVDHRIPPGRV